MKRLTAFTVSVVSSSLVACGGGVDLDSGPLVVESRPLEGEVSLDPGTIVTFSSVTFNGAEELVRLDDLDGTGLARTDLGGAIRHRASHPAFDQEGRLWFLEIDQDARLLRIDPFEGTLDIVQDAPELTLQFVSDLTVGPDGRIYFTDILRHQLVRMDDMSGQGMVRLGGQGPGPGIGMFDEPSGVAVAPDGRIAVSDRNNERIVLMDDMSGSGWQTLPMHGLDPMDVAFSPDGETVYAVSFWPTALARFQGGSESAEILPTGGQPSDVHIDAEGALVISFVNGTNSLGRLPDFDLPDELVEYSGPEDEPFINPNGIAIRDL